MGFYVGIDLGTTNSTVSVIQTKNTDDSPLDTLTTCPIFQYKTIGEFIADECLPSALNFDIDNRRVYTGLYAKNIYASGEQSLQTAVSVKTRIGSDARLEIPSRFRKNITQIFDMKECSAFFIRTIVDSLKKNFPKLADIITNECVVTVPAAFNDDERVATQNAVLLGGFKSCKILDEPTAALLSYINSDSYDDSADDDTIYKLVYDIGGGTLDVSIAKLTTDFFGDYKVDIVALSDRMNLGGDNLDRLLGAYFLKEFENTNEPIQSYSKEKQAKIIARIVSQAEDCKIKLNKLILNCGNDQRKLDKVKLGVEFELIDNMYVNGIVLNKKILDELFTCYTSPEEKFGLIAPIKTALQRANLKKENISEVILTGGMAQFYAVNEAIHKFFKDIPISTVEDTRIAVSRGAALYHWSLDEDNDADDVKKISTISNRLAANIYVRNSEGIFELLVPYDLSETKGTFNYIISDDNVTYFPFYLYSGNGDITTTYTQLAGRMIKAKPEYKRGSKIPIDWEIDENKVITIKIQDDDNIKLSRLLTPAEISNNVINRYSINRS